MKAEQSVAPKLRDKGDNATWWWLKIKEKSVKINLKTRQLSKNQVFQNNFQTDTIITSNPWQNLTARMIKAWCTWIITYY